MTRESRLQMKDAPLQRTCELVRDEVLPTSVDAPLHVAAADRPCWDVICSLCRFRAYAGNQVRHADTF
jgi:hypothetical protein